MKKAICALMVVFLFGFIFTACNDSEKDQSSDYVSKSGWSVVSLPEDYKIFYEEDNEMKSVKFDENLNNADTVNGKAKIDGYDYYSVSNNTPFRIFTPPEVIREKNENKQTLVYWKVNGTFYKDCDGSYSKNTFACVQDTEIIPLYYEFRPVGMILIAADENYSPVLSESEVFDENGNIKEQDPVHYFYGVYDFEPNREFWRTNLLIDDFHISDVVKPANGINKRVYTISIKIKKSTIFDKGSIIVEELYKIDGHGYIIGNDASNLVKVDDATNAMLVCFIGEHQIQYTFVD